MKIFTNKKIWQKIVIAILVLMLFQIFLPKPSNALSGDVLLEPVTSLFANLGDGIMNILHKTFMNMDTAGAWVPAKENPGFWEKVGIALIALVVATVCIVATVMSGGAALGVIAGIAGAVIKIGIGVAVAYLAVDFLHFGDNGFYLPEFHLTPQSIFKDEILAFDVDFFNPKENEGGTQIKVAVVPKDYNSYEPYQCCVQHHFYLYAYNICNDDDNQSLNHYDSNKSYNSIIEELHTHGLYNQDDGCVMYEKENNNRRRNKWS